MRYHTPVHYGAALYCDDLSITSSIHILWEREQYDNPLTEWPSGGFRRQWVLTTDWAVEPLRAIADNEPSPYCIDGMGNLVWVDETQRRFVELEFLADAVEHGEVAKQ
jgi:hypothetical protein